VFNFVSSGGLKKALAFAKRAERQSEGGYFTRPGPPSLAGIYRRFTPERNGCPSAIVGFLKNGAQFFTAAAKNVGRLLLLPMASICTTQ